MFMYFFGGAYVKQKTACEKVVQRALNKKKKSSSMLISIGKVVITVNALEINVWESKWLKSLTLGF